MEPLNRDMVKQLREKLEEALSLVQVEGVKVTVGHATFTGDQVIFKVEVARVTAGGVALSREVTDLKAMAPLYGLPTDALDRKFKANGKLFIIKGCKPKSHTYPILAANATTGKVFKFPATVVKAGLLPA